MKLNELKNILADYESHMNDPMDTDDPRVAAVKAAIARLSEAERRVFVLHVDGYSFRELARIMNVSRDSLRGYYNRTLAKIRKDLETK